jgi:hypothetical protein
MLQVIPDFREEPSSAMAFMSDYLRNGGVGGRPSLRALHFFFLESTEDLSCLADAFLLGGGRGTAPNLEELHFECVFGEEKLEQLGPHLFGREALANITTLRFQNVSFDIESMSGLMDGFRQSGHEGSTLKKLVFDWCNSPFCEEEDEAEWHFDDEAERSMYLSKARDVSLPLIAGLRDGLFSNLEELSTSGGALLVGEVAELVEMVRGGVPCAQTLKKMVMSKHFLQPVDIEPLQAVLPHAMVTLG